MNNRRSLEFQASCIADVLPAARSDEIRAGLEAAQSSLLWFHRRAELIRTMEAMRRSRPELYALVHEISNTWPGVTIEDVRKAGE